MRNLLMAIQRFLSEDNGVTAIEYALLGGLIAMVIITAVGGVGQSLDTIYLYVANKVSAVAAGLP